MSHSPSKIWEEINDEETIMFPHDVQKQVPNEKRRIRLTDNELFQSTMSMYSTNPKGTVANVDNDLFRPSQDYQAHVMHFLKNPVNYNFSKSIMLQKAKYSYKVSHIAEQDLSGLYNILAVLNPDLKIRGSEVYMTGKEVIFGNTQYPDKDIDFNSAIPWRLIIQIQGYKESPTKKVTPIWKITHAYQSI